MSRVLSLSLADALYDRISGHAASQGLTVYQYVRRAIEMRTLADDRVVQMPPKYCDDICER